MQPRGLDLRTFLASEPVAIVAELSSVKGSSPRAEGTFMVVGATGLFGTIGGGALEYLVIEHARRLIRDGRAEEVLDVPLGPEIGQCCGGRVEVSLGVVNAERAEALVGRLEAERSRRAHVYVFGAGHVGRALARCLALLPVVAHVIDTRRDEMIGLPEGVLAQVVAMPEAVVRAAPEGSAFVIVTHDHALDFLIVQEALARTDAAYVGMVGSRTKRARFVNWYIGEGGRAETAARLISPIGRSGQEGFGDKRPEVIAALAAAEIMVHIGQWEARDVRVPAPEGVADGR